MFSLEHFLTPSPPSASDKAALKVDYSARAQEGLSKRYSDVPPSAPERTTSRSILAHFALKSPERYAAIRSVLAETRKRLEGGLPDGAHDRPWLPTRLVEWDCQGAEGMWAFDDVYCKDLPEDGTQGFEFYGSESDFKLLHVGADLAAQSAPTPSSAWRSSLSEEKGALHIDFKEHIKATLSPRPTQRPPKQSSAGNTILLSAFKLSSLPTDAKRQEYVAKMWKQADCDVLVIIDEATPRGFACVASARAQLLEHGHETDNGPTERKKGEQVLKIGGQVFYEQGAAEDSEPSLPSSARTLAGGAHVVAPCPHDRPCPLLHPFSTMLPPDSSSSGNKSATSFSRGLPICGFPQTLHLPRYTRLAQRRPGAAQDGQVNYSYVVVRRGHRPSFASGSLESSDSANKHAGEKQSAEEMIRSFHEELETRGAAAKTKVGDIDAIRKGETAGQTAESIRVLSELGAEGDSNASRPEAEEDDEAAAELLKLMPEALQRIREEAGPDSSVSDEALRDALAQMGLSPDQPLPTDASMQQKGQAEAEPTQVTEEDLAAMRLEAYSWPRLIKPPLKKGGHVTFDACCASGAVERFTIAKSAGKQPYQDARKAMWGDLFPHESKNGKSVVQVPAAAVDHNGQGLTAAELGYPTSAPSAPKASANAQEDPLDGLFTSDEDALEEEMRKYSPTSLAASAASKKPNGMPSSQLGPDVLALARGEKNASNVSKYKGNSKRSGRRSTVEYTSESSAKTAEGKPRGARRTSRKRSMGDYDVFSE